MKEKQFTNSYDGKNNNKLRFPNHCLSGRMDECMDGAEDRADGRANERGVGAVA